MKTNDDIFSKDRQIGSRVRAFLKTTFIIFFTLFLIMVMVATASTAYASKPDRKARKNMRQHAKCERIGIQKNEKASWATRIRISQNVNVTKEIIAVRNGSRIEEINDKVSAGSDHVSLPRIF